MPSILIQAAAIALCSTLVLAAPAPAEETRHSPPKRAEATRHSPPKRAEATRHSPPKRAEVTKVAERQAYATSITDADELAAAIESLSADLESIAAVITVGEAILTNIVPLPGPTAVSQLAAEFSAVSDYADGDEFKYGADVLYQGLAGGNYLDIAEAYLLESNTVNVNPLSPDDTIYPYKSSADAPYSLSEDTLREAIYIPYDFTYGEIEPVIFLPGTAAVAGQNFGPNFGTLFAQNKIADPVYVNIPGTSLGDIQVSAEYAAYAVNYISGICGNKNVSTLSWSQGSLTSQWALKYWPSTRSVVSNKIGISPDYHGTIEAQVLCPGIETPGCTPSVAQQNYNSTFIATLRNNGGDTAYVPTTNVYSIFDEIVEPQQNPDASGGDLSAGAAGVTNVELQAECTALLPGGTPNNDHEGVLYNALAYALAADALTNGGPAQLSRVNVTYECEQFVAPGLDLADALATHALIPIAIFNILAYEPKVAAEPAIMAYAQKDIPAGY